MPTPTDDQSHTDGPGIASAEGEATRVTRVSSEFTGDTEVIYEVQEHDFIVDPDETIELPTGPSRLVAPSLAAAKLPPPLPPWAAASRALLHDVSRTDSGHDGPPIFETSALRELREAREDLVRFARQMYAREVYVQEVERALAAAQGRARGQAFRMAELEAELRERVEQRRAEDATVPVRLDADTRPPPAPTPARSPSKRPTNAGGRKAAVVRDDLQRIRGIGPRMAERLNAIGIASFESVASWKIKDLERVAKELGVSRERIERAGWVKQAKALSKHRRS
jgi:predicted flap endonuclease-1-like 5' DNA nuclease